MPGNKKLAILCAAWLAGAVFVSACDSGKCTPCDESNPCPELTGEYIGTLTSISDSCDEWDLPAGNFSLKLLSMSEDENGNEVIQCELTYNSGSWDILDGWMCNAAEDEVSPKHYTFGLSSVSTDADGTKNSYTINGNFLADNSIA